MDSGLPKEVILDEVKMERNLFIIANLGALRRSQVNFPIGSIIVMLSLTDVAGFIKDIRPTFRKFYHAFGMNNIKKSVTLVQK